MNVLQLSSERAWRGGEQQIAYLIHELGKQGVRNFAGVRQKSAFQKFCVENRIDHIDLSFSIFRVLNDSVQLKNYCRQHQIDIIHVHSSKSHTLASISATLGNGARIVVSRRVDFPIGNTFFNRWKYNHKQVGAILCVSNVVTERVRAFVTKPEMVKTVYSGIDLNRFSPHADRTYLRNQFKIPLRSTIVGNTSALESEKDYFTFIKVIGNIRRKGFDVVGMIIGKGSQMTELAEFVRSKNLENFIHFSGFRNNIGSIIAGFDIFLMTSRQEGLGTSVLDAFLCNVPVVSTDAGGLPEMVVDGQTGLLAKVGDDEALAEACVRILQDPHLATTLTRNSYEKAKSFSKEEMASATLSVYRNIPGTYHDDASKHRR